MRVVTLFAVSLLLVGCGGSGGGSGGGDRGGIGPPIDTTCTVDAQKQTTLDVAREWYLWNDELPVNINLDDFATVNDLVFFITRSSPVGNDGFPVDRFGGISPAAEEQQFFEEGQFEGYGFNFRYLDTSTELFISRVIADSPAGVGGLERGQQVLALNGTPVADIVNTQGVNALFDLFDTSPLVFTLQPVDGDSFDTDPIERGLVTIDPLTRERLIPRPGQTPVGYFEFYRFISTAESQLDAVFADFKANNVSEVIVDLRYNSGGIVTTTNFFGDLLGGFVAPNLIFSETRWNADKASENTIRLFNLLANSINLSQLVVIATAGTASASEMIANGLAPHVDVAIVGADTFGKPIGQSGFLFCDNVLRLTTIQLFNADGFGEYFDGLPVTTGCDAPDDISVDMGADADPNLIAALNYFGTGTCQAAPAAQPLKVAAPEESQRRPDHHRRLEPIYGNVL